MLHIAISGLVSTIYKAQNKSAVETEAEPWTTYLAGIWRHTLVRDLAWFVGESLLQNKDREQKFEITGSSTERKARPAQYLAPSWSWASVLDPVQYLSDSDLEPLFELLDTHISHETDEPFGSVTEGCFCICVAKYLRARGNYAQAQMALSCLSLPIWWARSSLIGRICMAWSSLQTLR
jgi:hypothetical protein